MKILFSVFTTLFVVFTFNNYSQTIFKYAAEGNIEGLKSLLKNNLSLLESKDNNGKTALSFATEKGQTETVKFLIGKGADVNTQSNYGTTPLHYAAFYNYAEVLQILIDNKAKLDLYSNFIPTPISFAASRGNTIIVLMLIENGADVNARNLQNKTPLHFAAEGGYLDCVKFLLGAGAKKDILTQTGESILHSACIGGNTEVINLFIGMKEALGNVDKYGKTPLFDAVENGKSDVVNLILEDIHPDLSNKTNDGNTYLHAAVQGGLKDFALKCIDFGIDVNAANAFGLTPLDIAEKLGKAEMIDLLKQHGAESHFIKDLTGRYVDENQPGYEPILFAPGIISTPDFNERDVTFTPAGDEIYFTRYPMDKTWNIMTMKKQDNIWVPPHKVSFSSEYIEAEASITPDGTRIFFISSRPKTMDAKVNSVEIWYSDKEKGDWGIPKLLGDKFEGGYYPTFTKDGTMYFTNADRDICRSPLVNGTYNEIINLGDSINTSQSEYNSLVAPDEGYLIFTSKGQGAGYGNDDLFICFRKEDGTWTHAKNMGEKINSFAREYCPALSYDGKYFFFCSTRYGTEDIFWVDAKIIDELK